MDRETRLKLLFQETFDVLVIGGGATGAGIALDATLRGHKTALIEAADFSSGSSSRSTKLLHGGVRYLEKAFLNFDFKQLKLVRDSLRERAVLMQLAPHLTGVVPIILPIYSSFKKLYYWAGLKFYEWLSGSYQLGVCRGLDADEVVRQLPGLLEKGLVGGISYADGQFDDARFNLALIQTAVERGGVALNYVRLNGFVKTDGLITGAFVEDCLSGALGEIKAKVVVNAAGCFADSVRQMDQPQSTALLAPSRGTHIVLKRKSLPIKSGFLFPGTTDGRVIFGLPWLDDILIGTTDLPCNPEQDPQPTEEEIRYLLDHAKRYFAAPFGRDDVVAAWSGIRPLFKGGGTIETSNLSRDHHIERSASGLYTIVGGKWTTYRLMAKDLLDTLTKNGVLNSGGPCTTRNTMLVGADHYTSQLPAELAKSGGVPQDVALHLARSYGGRALLVLNYVNQGFSKRLYEGFPYIEAEVAYAVHNEFACNAQDVLYRRLRLGFLDQKIAHSVERRIDEIIALC